MFYQSPLPGKKQSQGPWPPSSTFPELIPLHPAQSQSWQRVPEETIGVSVGVQCRISIALRTRETVPEWQMHNTANSGDKGGDRKSRQLRYGSCHYRVEKKNK